MKFFNRNKVKKDLDINQSLSPNVVSINRKADLKGEMHFLDAKTILSDSLYAHRIQQIREVSGVNKEFFNEFYLPAIHNLAVRLQSCPASKSHHHSYEYGLIDHTLEVAVFAMRYSQSFNYFPDGDEEKIQILQYVFVYSVFIGALLHDAAKMFTDYSFKIYTNDKWVEWNPLYSKIPSESDQVPYRIFRKETHQGIQYKKNTHEIAASCLITEIVPAVGLKWVHDFSQRYAPSMMSDMLHTIASDYHNGNAIGKSVMMADQESTRLSVEKMGSTGQISTEASSQQPIHEAFLSAFSAILNDPSSYRVEYNGRFKGKNSHVERFGDVVFLSAKTMKKKATEYLTKRGITVPAENKIDTILCETNAAISTPCNDTLWWITFFKAEDDTSKTKDVAYIAIDANKLNLTTIQSLDHEIVLPFFSSRVTGLDKSQPFSRDIDEKFYNLLYPASKQNNDKEALRNEKSAEVVANEHNSDLGTAKAEPDSEGEDFNNSILPSFETMVNESSNVHEPETDHSHDAINTENNELHAADSTTETVQNEQPVDDDLSTILGIQTPSTSNNQESVKPKPLFTKPSGKGLQPPVVDADTSDSKKVKEADSQQITPAVEQPVESDDVELTREQLASIMHSNKDIPYWLKTGNTSRKARANIYDKECLDSFFPYIQQMINDRQISFNRKDSPLHYTKYGLFLVSPLFFEGMSKNRTTKLKRTLKRSHFVYFDGDQTMIEMESSTVNEFKKSSGSNRVSGFLLNFHELTYLDKPLPVNNMMELVEPKNKATKKSATAKKQQSEAINTPLTPFNFKG